MPELQPIYWIGLILVATGSFLWGCIKWLANIVISNFKELLNEIKGSVSELRDCLVKNETSFEEFRTINESREVALQKEIQDLGGKIEHMNNNVKGYGEQINRINNVIMTIEDKLKEHHGDIRALFQMVNEIKGKL